MSPQPDVMTLLENARPADLDPAPDPGRRQRDLTRALGEPRSGGRTGIQWRSVVRPGRIAAGLGVAAAAAAIAVATTSGPLTGSGSDSPSAPRPAAKPAALSGAQVLLIAADRVRTAPTTGRYWRTTTDLYSLELAGPAADPYVVRSGDRNQDWVARSESGSSVGASRGLGLKPASAADRAAWERDGSPTTFAVHGPWNAEGSRPSKSGDRIADLPGAPTGWTVDRTNPDSAEFFVGHDLTMRDVQALPADPVALRAFLLTDLARNITASKSDPRGATWTEEDWLFSTATDLLALPVAPDVRASAYRIMAEIKGVQSLGTVKDMIGRTGDAVAIQGDDTHGRFEKRIVIDTRTGLLLAEETRYLKPKAELSWLKPTDVRAATVVREIGWTDDKPPATTKNEPTGPGVG